MPQILPKKNEGICLFFAVKSKKAKKKQKKFVRLFVFWENLQRTDLLMVLSDLYIYPPDEKLANPPRKAFAILCFAPPFCLREIGIAIFQILKPRFLI